MDALTRPERGTRSKISGTATGVRRAGGARSARTSRTSSTRRQRGARRAGDRGELRDPRADRRRGRPVAFPSGSDARIDAHRGRLDRARAACPDRGAVRAERQQLVRGAGAGDARHGCAGGRRPCRRRRRLRPGGEALESIGVVCPLPFRGEPEHVEALVALGEHGRARAVLEVLAGARHPGCRAARSSATLPRARAILLAAEGDPGAALALLEQDAKVPELPVELARLLLRAGPAGAAAEASRCRSGEPRSLVGALRAGRSVGLGRAGPRRGPARPRRASAGGTRRAHARGAANRGARGHRADKPGGRRGSVRQRQDGRGEPRPRLSQARDPLSRRARRARGWPSGRRGPVHHKRRETPDSPGTAAA